MIFLIDYDRRAAQIRVFRAFSDAERAKAEQLRLELEIQGRSDAEVVLLESEDEDTVRKTHARYFQSASELLRAE
jgi:hypothetical protein